MFKKVLVAEDFQDTNLGIVDALRNKLDIEDIQEEYYCDNAYNRIKTGLEQQEPFQLLIADLSFKPDHVTQRFTSGLELVRAARKIQPDLKVIINSMEDNPGKVNDLFKEEKIDAYVCKGRHGLAQLMEAVQEVFHNRTYYSPQINLNGPDNIFELDKFDLMILKDLADGLTKKEISTKLKKSQIVPNSESTIDKRVSKLFDVFGAKNTNHLIAKLVRKDWL